MVAPLAIILALAFWAPYSREPVCPLGVQINYFAPGTHGKDTQGWSDEITKGNCDFLLSTEIVHSSIPHQCSIIAHELGHRFMGLNHSSDPSNIMYSWVPTPRICRLKQMGPKAKAP